MTYKGPFQLKLLNDSIQSLLHNGPVKCTLLWVMTADHKLFLEMKNQPSQSTDPQFIMHLSNSFAHQKVSKYSFIISEFENKLEVKLKGFAIEHKQFQGLSEPAERYYFWDKMTLQAS